MAKKNLQDIDVAGKRVLVRVDFNVPLENQGGEMVITDDKRVKATLPTLKHLLKNHARIILCSHLGRPKGKAVPEMSLKPVAACLSSVIGQEVKFAPDCIGQEAIHLANGLQDGEVLLLENLRYYAEEEKNDEVFAKKLAELAEVYVNDAFGSAHRAHASTAGVAAFIPVSAAGFLMESELKFLGGELEKPKRPFVVILGGAKVSDKINVIDALLDKADTILIGGAMAYTFALAQGRKVGDSLSEPDKVETAKAAMEKAKEKGVQFLLPIDTLIVEELDFRAKQVSPGKYTEEGADIPEGWEGVDIGPKTVELYEKEISKAALVVWNGPMGVFEIADCSKGTFAIADAIVANTQCTSIIGGGDSAKAVKKAGLADKVSFVSTGGGASLEFLEGKALPGVEAIQDKPSVGV
ncbi:MAG: phosphoglycerate kinase [Verrucomicrobiota bacterium]